MIAGLRSLKERYPQNRSIRITMVQLLAQNQQFEAALAEFQELSDTAELTPDLVRLQAQLYQSVDQPESSLEALRTGLEQFPGNRGLRLTYARALLQQRQLEAGPRAIRHHRRTGA